MHDVAVLDDVFLAFHAHLAGGTNGGFRLILDEVVILDDLGADETFLEVAVDHTGGLRRLVSLADGPGAALVRTGGEESLQAQQAVGALDQADDAGLFQTQFFQEHLTVFVILDFGDIRLGLRGDDQDFRVLLLDGFPDRVDICVALGGGGFIDIADIHDRLVGQQVQVLGHGFFIGILGNDRPAGFPFQQGCPVAFQQVQQFLGFLVRPDLGLFGHLGDAAFDGLQVLDLQFCIDNFLVPDRIYAAVDVDDVAVVKTTQYVQDGVGFPDVGQELVAQAFSFTGPFDKTGDVDDVDRGRNGPFRLADVRQDFQPLVRNIGRSEVRLDGAEREIGALGFTGADAVEKGGFADVRKADDSAFETHVQLYYGKDVPFIPCKDSQHCRFAQLAFPLSISLRVAFSLHQIIIGLLLG